MAEISVLVSKKIYDAFMLGPAGIELFHGYTYSAHPIACAAGLATLDHDADLIFRESLAFVREQSSDATLYQRLSVDRTDLGRELLEPLLDLALFATIRFGCQQRRQDCRLRRRG